MEFLKIRKKEDKLYTGMFRIGLINIILRLWDCAFI